MKIRLLLTSAILIIASMCASAQEYSRGRYANPVTDSVRQLINDAYKAEMAPIVVSFWESRLPEYRATIDRILSANDLTKLNKLRARFSMLLVAMQEMQKKSEETSRSYTYDTAMAVSVDTTMTAPVPEPYDGMDTVSYATTETTDAVASEQEMRENEQMMRENEQRWREQADRSREKRLDDEEAAIIAGTSGMPTGEYDYSFMLEYMELPAVAKWLASDYRENMDVLMERVLTDLDAFVQSFTAFNARFVQQHQHEIAMVPDMVADFDRTAGTKELAAMLRHPNVMRKTYLNHIEPLVMLYQGGELGKILGIVGPNIAVDQITTSQSMLKSNAPNPASTSTTVSFALPNESSATTVRVFDTQGIELISNDLGVMSAGDHSTVVDVSSLPSGRYMVQLTAKLPKGERTSSSLLNVAR